VRPATQFREGSDKPRRVPVEPHLNADERAAQIQVRSILCRVLDTICSDAWPLRLMGMLMPVVELGLPILQDDKKMICPKSALDKVLKRLGGEAEFAFVGDKAKQHLARIAEDMLERSIEFGALMAASQGSGWMQVRECASQCSATKAVHDAVLDDALGR
jgi:hypothetical protein